jgi:hypothetical protein
MDADYRGSVTGAESSSSMSISVDRSASLAGATSMTGGAESYLHVADAVAAGIAG